MIQKQVAVLTGISIILASLLGLYIMRDGVFALGDLANPAMHSSVVFPPSEQGGNATTGTNSVNTGSQSLDSESLVLNQVFEKTSGSVVQITSKTKTIVPNILFNGNPLERQALQLGSGFVYDTEGRIITNNHVIDGATQVDVTFVDGNTYTAKIIGNDAFADIAVLQIMDNAAADEHLVPLSLGNSSQLKVGQQTIAIGNPFGLSNTMTTGIVSQVGRLLPNPQMGFSIPNAVQTDAAINPGNSGGPLLDIQGNVIGLNAAIRSQTGEFSGVGFAIPSNTVARIVPHLIKDGKYDHPWLGIAGTSLSPDIVEQLGLPANFKGVAIASVTPGSPADKAGVNGRTQNDFPSGDIITAIDGHAVKRIEDVIFYIEEHAAVGEKVMVTVYRDGKSIDLGTTLEARPAPLSQTG